MSGRLANIIDEIGFGAVTREDEAFMVGAGSLRRSRILEKYQRPLVEGGVVRDLVISNPIMSLWPYDAKTLEASADGDVQSLIWPYRVGLQVRTAYGQTQLERGLAWFEYSMFFRKRYSSPFILAFAFVATHNHFVLDRGGKVFIRTAPVIKLPESATEDDHLALLGVLNSSTACFWLKQVSYPKGGDPMGDEGARVSAESWSDRYEFTGTKLEQFPLPEDLPFEFGRELDALAQQLASVEPSAVCAEDVPTLRRLDAAHVKHEWLRRQMIALQEELDWDVYHRYGLITDGEVAELVAKPGSVPELKLGERAFEIVLARRVERGELETQWFARHRSTPITEIPAEWPEDYQQVVAKRIEMIEWNRNIGLIERPECKRRWQSDPWEVKEQAALTTWLLDRCEERLLWFDGGSPRPMTVNRLADRLRADADVVSVARLLKGQDADLADVLREIIAEEHVPFVAQYRYKPPGLDKRRQWERTWDLQREEDATDKKLKIDVPPKYASVDFQKNSYWRHRGKLDVPKERFISYPDASPDSDAKSLLIGWAGWDHRERADALVWLIGERSSTDGWNTLRLMGLLAGLLEVMPWVRQWHGEIVPEFHQSWAEAYDGFLTSERESRSLTEDDLRNWRPPQPARGRRPR